MRVSAKVGSALRIPVLAGWTCSSGNPSVCTAGVSGTVLTLQALAPGTSKLTLKPASDVGFELQIDVVTS